VLTGTCADVSATVVAESERAALEDRLRQAQKMESLGQLAAGVAHDLNNLLTPILIGAEMVRDHLPPDGAAAEHIDSAQTAARNAADLVRQLLAFGRQQVLEVRALDLNEEVRRGLRLLGRLLPESIEIELVLEQGLPAIEADAVQLQQVLMNLVVNARDAMPAGGTIVISTAWRTAQHAVALGVADTGVGMDEATRARIFDPFFTTKERGRGTGLGLATVHGIVHQHGGSIRVDSAPGRGTRFEILLPAALAMAERARPAAAATTGRGVETVLVVEDQASVRRLAGHALAAGGYQVLTAAHPGAAVRLARDHVGKIDLLLADVVLPAMNGPALHQEMRRFRPDLRVLFMSGHAPELLGAHGVLVPGVLLLRKPFAGSALREAVRSALDAASRE
jgi:CheY-like chemotaxis protein